MEVQDVPISYKLSGSKFRLYAIGCTHLGTIHCLEKDIQEMVYQIKNDDNSMWIEMGDSGEFIVLQDKRSDLSNLASWVDPIDIVRSQERRIVELYKPIASKCVGKIEGNHEASIRLHYNRNVQAAICEALEIKNLTSSTWLRLFFNRANSKETHLLKGVFTHGASGATTLPGKVGALVSFMDNYNDAHFAGYGHVHAVVTDVERVRLSVEGKFNDPKICDFVTKGALTGAWFTTYTQGTTSSYGERKGYKPTPLGCVVYEFDLSKPLKDIISIRKA